MAVRPLHVHTYISIDTSNLPLSHKRALIDIHTYYTDIHTYYTDTHTDIHTYYIHTHTAYTRGPG